MENKKILAGVLATWILALWATSVFAIDNSLTGSATKSVKTFSFDKENWFWEKRQEGWCGMMKGNKMEWMKMGMGKNLMDLTEDEKTALKSMTDEEKQTFFENKQEENKKKMELRESVIGKLLNGETLTVDEETIRKEMIKERTDKKAEQEKRNKIQSILEKNSNGETLTEGEKELLLEHFLNNKQSKMKWFKKGQESVVNE